MSESEHNKVYLKFTKTINGIEKKFVIQKLPFSVIEKAVQFMNDYFVMEVPVFSAAITISKEYLDIINSFWKEFIIPQDLSIVCFEDDDNVPLENKEIIGFNFLCISNIDDPPLPYNEDENILIKVLHLLEDKASVYKEFDVKEYLNAFGLCVHPNYRGHKIGQYLLEARLPICKERGIKVTGTMFSGIGSQKIAARLNYKLLFEMEVEEMSRLTGIEFDKKHKSIQIMGKVMLE